LKGRRKLGLRKKARSRKNTHTRMGEKVQRKKGDNVFLEKNEKKKKEKSGRGREEREGSAFFPQKRKEGKS